MRCQQIILPLLQYLCHVSCPPLLPPPLHSLEPLSLPPPYVCVCLITGAKVCGSQPTSCQSSWLAFHKYLDQPPLLRQIIDSVNAVSHTFSLLSLVTVLPIVQYLSHTRFPVLTVNLRLIPAPVSRPPASSVSLIPLHNSLLSGYHSAWHPSQFPLP